MNQTVKILNEMVEEFEIISESTEAGKLTKIKGLFTTVEARNKNGRIYPKSIFEREVQKLQEGIKRGSVLGELEHPQRTTIDYEQAVIKVNKLYMEGNQVLGEAIVIPAGKGLIIEGLIKVGAQIGISSRAVGSLDENKIVKNDLQLITYDIVADPSNHNSYMSAIEESKSYIIESNGSLIEAYNELDKNLEKLPSHDRERIIQEAIIKFLSSLK
jgi:hypothetical protein